MTKTLRERAESWVAAYRKNPDYTSKWDAFELLSDLLTADEPAALKGAVTDLWGAQVCPKCGEPYTPIPVHACFRPAVKPKGSLGAPADFSGGIAGTGGGIVGPSGVRLGDGAMEQVARDLDAEIMRDAAKSSECLCGDYIVSRGCPIHKE